MPTEDLLERRVPSGVDTALLGGFEVTLNKGHTERIDRLVDQYEAQIVAHLEQEYTIATRWSDQLADAIAGFGGSWTFITVFAVALTFWILLNTWNYLAHFRFDPPPYILLNLVLSFVAAFQAPIILMSQNRQAARDRRESIIDFAINYKAEQEIDDIQAHLHRMEAKLDQLEALLRG